MAQTGPATVHTRTCMGTHTPLTVYTCHQSLDIFPQSPHPWVAGNSNDNITDSSQGIVSTPLLQAIVKNLILQSCATLSQDYTFNTFINHTHI